MRTLSNVRVRNVARVGGALAHGDPHMDLPPVLTALGAYVAISGPKQNRHMPLEELYSGYYETVLEKNELITAVTVPALGGRKAVYMKVTSRTADDWPALGVAVSFALKDGAVRDPIVVVSAATEKVTRMRAAEQALQGAAPNEVAFRPRRRRGGRRSGNYFRRPRLSAVQARTPAGLPAPRSARGIWTEARRRGLAGISVAPNSLGPTQSPRTRTPAPRCSRRASSRRATARPARRALAPRPADAPRR